MTPSVLELAAELARRAEPFVLVTVVWRRGPSSGRQGSKAIVLLDGTVRGWLGGACAEPSVVKEALRALEDGAPRLMFLGPADEFDGRLRQGVTSVPMACDSEGAMEVYLEPTLPRPHLLAIGRSPAVATLVSLSRALGWRTTVVDDGGSVDDHADADRVVTTLDLSGLAVDDRTYVVVATQGHYDEPALQAALQTDAGYVGLVASKKRAQSVLEYLRDRGVPDGALRRVRAPAGLDLGKMEHEEIAVAVLAELVALKAAGELRSGVEPKAAVDEVIDPVCAMTVDASKARYQTEHEGTVYYFCGAGCQRQFEADPTKFVAAAREQGERSGALG